MAPYEADAQMAFMCNQGLVDAVITEDSDMIAYACRRTLFKLDHREGCVQELLFPDLANSRALDLSSFDPKVCAFAAC